MSAGDRFFVDSNVLLYAVDPVENEKRARAIEWLDWLWAAGSGRLSWQVLHEFYWNAVRKMRMEKREARAMVENFSHWKPVDTSLALIQQAWGWMDSAEAPYWDALIVAAAQRSGARYLLSEDFPVGRRYEELQVLDPFRRSPTEFDV